MTAKQISWLRRPTRLGVILLLPAVIAVGGGQRLNGDETTQNQGHRQRVVAARVDDRPIYVAQVERTLRRALAGHRLEGTAFEELQARTLEQLVSRRVILAYLRRNGLAASEQDVELELARIEKQLEQQELTLAEYLQQGRFLDEEDLRGTLAWQLGWGRYLDRLTTDDNLRKHFERRKAEFDGTELEVAHLLLKVEPRDDPAALERTLTRARSLRADILSGKTTFAEAARGHSIAPTAEQGGRLPRIGRHGALPEPVAAAAFRLGKGEISGPVVSTFGVHLVQCLDVIPGQKPFEAVRDLVEADARRFLFEWVVSQQRPQCRVEYTGAAPYFRPGTDEIVRK